MFDGDVPMFSIATFDYQMVRRSCGLYQANEYNWVYSNNINHKMLFIKH